MADCGELRMLEKGVPLESLGSVLAERIQDKVADIEFRVLRRITETQFHTEDLHECAAEEHKYNRYSDVIPCTPPRLILRLSQADQSEDKPGAGEREERIHKRELHQRSLETYPVVTAERQEKRLYRHPGPALADRRDLLGHGVPRKCRAGGHALRRS